MRPAGAILSIVLFVSAAIGDDRLFSDDALDAVARQIVEEGSSGTPDRDQQPFWTLAAWLAAATIYDVETTFYVREHCDTCDEQNPVTAPIVESGRLATYAWSLAVDAAVLYLARRLRDRGEEWWRVIPIALTIVHFVAGSWNLYTTTLPPS